MTNLSLQTLDEKHEYFSWKLGWLQCETTSNTFVHPLGLQFIIINWCIAEFTIKLVLVDNIMMNYKITGKLERIFKLKLTETKDNIITLEINDIAV